MNREYLLKKVKNRKSQMNMTIDNIAKLSKLGNRTVVRFFGGEDVKLSTLEKITNVLGLDFAGNEMVDIDILREQRAKERALYIVSLVQDTSALEMQGLEKRELDILIEDTKREFLYGAYQKNLWAS
jgi:transcriptional regulator with XRE-family HTH domain